MRGCGLWAGAATPALALARLLATHPALARPARHCPCLTTHNAPASVQQLCLATHGTTRSISTACTTPGVLPTLLPQVKGVEAGKRELAELLKKAQEDAEKEGGEVLGVACILSVGVCSSLPVSHTAVRALRTSRLA